MESNEKSWPEPQVLFFGGGITSMLLAAPIAVALFILTGEPGVFALPIVLYVVRLIGYPLQLYLRHEYKKSPEILIGALIVITWGGGLVFWGFLEAMLWLDKLACRALFKARAE